MTLSDTNSVKNIILAEDVIDSNLLFKESLNESNFVSNSFSSVDLDFEDVVLLLSQVFKEVVSLNFFFFIKFSFSSVNISKDMGHTGFESTEGCEMRSLGSIISREWSYSSSLMFSSVSGEESEITFSGQLYFLCDIVIK